jgi:hypothetical protein
MSTDQVIPGKVSSVPPEAVLDEDLGFPNAPGPAVSRSTSEERGRRAKVIADRVAHLEQIPTADLSTAAPRRLSVVAIEVSGADFLGGERLQAPGSVNDPRHLSSKTHGTQQRGQSTGCRCDEGAMNRRAPGNS